MMILTKYDNRRKGWFCEHCGTFYQEKEQAQFCESRHQALSQWAAGNIDDLQLAGALGFDVSTTQAQTESIQRVRDMTLGGQDLGAKSSMTRPFLGGMGTLVGLTQVHGGGRTQIPAQIRAQMGLQDGDNVVWYEKDSRYYITSVNEIPYWDKPKGYSSPPR